MVGTTSGNSLDGDTDRLRSGLMDPPAAAEVEAQLQQIARRRLAPPPGTEPGSNSHRTARSLRHQRPPLVGAFDSPTSFAFGSDGSSRKR